jgi:hypothetical protein
MNLVIGDRIRDRKVTTMVGTVVGIEGPEGGPDGNTDVIIRWDEDLKGRWCPYQCSKTLEKCVVLLPREPLKQ